MNKANEDLFKFVDSEDFCEEHIELFDKVNDQLSNEDLVVLMGSYTHLKIMLSSYVYNILMIVSFLVNQKEKHPSRVFSAEIKDLEHFKAEMHKYNTILTKVIEKTQKNLSSSKEDLT